MLKKNRSQKIFTAFTAFTTLAFLALFATLAAAAGVNVNLTADTMRYNPDSGEITAQGNVHLTRPDGELYGDSGFGNSNGREFELRGSVRGHFTSDDIDISCAYLKLSSEGTTPVRRIVAASGDVLLTRSADKISAGMLTWHIDGEKYSASGNVLANFEAYSIDADEAGRDDEKFWANGVRRYEDIQRDFTLSASQIDGLISDGRISELVASGSVTMHTHDEKGVPSHVTGNKGIFSVARGTLVVSGNATVTQQGRRLHAGNIVYHLDSGRIEALDRPSLVIQMPE